MSRRTVAPPEWYSIHRAARELAVTDALILANIAAGRITVERRHTAAGKPALMIHHDELARLRARAAA